MRFARNDDRNDGKWHRWFAWYPVFLTDAMEWCWLETVWRIGHSRYAGWERPWIEWEHCETVIEFTPDELLEQTTGITDLMRGGKAEGV